MTIETTIGRAFYSELLTAFEEGNDAGEGVAWTPDPSDTVAYRSQTTDEVDVILRGQETWLVGDVHGPWAVLYGVRG